LKALGRKAKTPASPERARLETFTNAFPDREYWVRFECPEFTSLCPVTGQPDFGRITIEYIPAARCIESKSLKLYLASFRNHGTFAESIVNLIRDRVVRDAKPQRLVVVGDFTARGGIGIRVSATYPQ
jgi:7-cyano-7-deazaguanine reductase